MNPESLPFNAFDVILLVVLAVGIFRGRKHGMSEELMPLITWLSILFICAVAYEPIGSLFTTSTGMFSKLSCYIIAYVGLALIILVLFAWLKRGLGGKLLGSDLFGKAEYYLGMGSGLIRFTCIVLAVLALLNARYYTSQEVKAEEKFQNDVYGSHYFPTLQNIQSTVFERSFVGPWIKDNLAFLLIKPTAPENKELHQKEAKLPY
jgi:uncharacterized membrane protein required for colicin V production